MPGDGDGRGGRRQARTGRDIPAVVVVVVVVVVGRGRMGVKCGARRPVHIIGLDNRGIYAEINKRRPSARDSLSVIGPHPQKQIKHKKHTPPAGPSYSAMTPRHAPCATIMTTMAGANRRGLPALTSAVAAADAQGLGTPAHVRTRLNVLAPHSQRRLRPVERRAEVDEYNLAS